MYTATVTISNKTGLHARPATNLVSLCQQFNSDITLHTTEDEINGKSIVSILAGGVMQGDTVRLEVEGSDEETAGNAVETFLKNLTE